MAKTERHATQLAADKSAVLGSTVSLSRYVRAALVASPLPCARSSKLL